MRRDGFMVGALPHASDERIPTRMHPQLNRGEAVHLPLRCGGAGWFANAPVIKGANEEMKR